MKSKQHKSSSPKLIELKSALNRSELVLQLNALNLEDLFKFIHDMRSFLFYWTGDPTEKAIRDLRNSYPFLDEVIDFTIVLQRLNYLDSFERTSFGVHIQTFMPELGEINEACISRMHTLPQGTYKAEYWLLPIAQEAGVGADVEASVYFASRGRKTAIDIDAMRNAWHSAICHDIQRGLPIGKVPEAVLERARSQTISLAEAAEVLKSTQLLPNFFPARDEEEDFIDAALFRAVDWLGISGFNLWLESIISELSIGPQHGIEHQTAGWWLFFWCRSDLALRMAERQGLEFWLWALVNGEIERDKPWQVFWEDPKNLRRRNYLPLVGIILFAWHRIKPTHMKEDVLQRATDLLLQTQMRCGGWPLFVDDSEPSLVTTCFAIHGLASHKPKDWQQIAARGAEWLMSQQESDGCWYIDGGPTVMLTVLVLDSLALAQGHREVTFKLDGYDTVEDMHGTATDQEMPTDPIYDYDQQEWFEPLSPVMSSISLDRAHEIARPSLAIIVATETELRQALRVLKPLSKQRHIWKTSHDHETYYLGRFGAFQSVIMLSSIGPEGATGATLSADAVIHEWDPKAVILVGIAFGASRKKHLPADILITEHLIPYEHQRVGDIPMFRNPIPPSSPALVNRFRNALDWNFYRPDGSKCSRHVGPVLSGEKLIDDQEFKDALLRQYPNAIGGEMEGAGLWSAAQRARKEWIIVKGVCDWADGRKHDNYQAMAAASAVSLCRHVFSDKHALDGI